MLQSETLITRDTASSSELKESSSEVREGMKMGGAVAQCGSPHPTGLNLAVPTSGKFPEFPDPSRWLSTKSRDSQEDGG